MNDLNQDLQGLFEKRRVWIYSDGGASTHGEKTGAYAAMILFPSGEHQFVVGTASQTKINRMELTAINAALYYVWAIHERGITHGIDIQIVTDSEVTMHGATGAQRGLTNQDLWLQFDELARHFDSIAITHMSRNLEPAQAQADAACHVFRVEFAHLLERFRANEAFGTLGIRRNTKI